MNFIVLCKTGKASPPDALPVVLYSTIADRLSLSGNLHRLDSQCCTPDLIRHPASFAPCFPLAHLRVLRCKGIKLLLQGRIQRKYAACPVLAGVDHSFQLKHRQSVLPPQIRQGWSVPSPRPPRSSCIKSRIVGVALHLGTDEVEHLVVPSFQMQQFVLQLANEVEHQSVQIGVNRQAGNLIEPLAGQFQISAAIGVEQLFSSNVSFIGLFLRIKKGLPCADPM